MTAIIEGLNVAYMVPEARPWWRRWLVAIGLTTALGILVAGASFLILAGGAAVERFGEFFPVMAQAARLSAVVQWSVGIFFLLLALTLIFRFAPNLRQPRWEANFPGAVLTLVCWLIASAGLKLYLSMFNSFGRIYGSLGAVIILLIWLYISGAAILIGGEFNSVIWQAVIRQRRQH